MLARVKLQRALMLILVALLAALVLIVLSKRASAAP
jgi:hypothetical protein